ncbi:MAG: response regulator [Deltaproteobacteria bacterium]|nr:MAG: response regulator [Deltaproteobacteria bacterium]
MSKRILAADDSRTIRKTLALTFLMEQELDLTVVDSGQAVLSAMQSGSYDLLLLDYNMPDIPGTQLCMRLRQDPNTSQLPIILLGGQHFEPNQANQVGASGLIRKPFLTSDLLDRVGELLHVSVKPIPAPMSSRMGILQNDSISIEIDMDGATQPPPQPNLPMVNTTPPPLPQTQTSPFPMGTPAGGTPTPPVMGQPVPPAMGQSVPPVMGQTAPPPLSQPSSGSHVIPASLTPNHSPLPSNVSQPTPQSVMTPAAGSPSSPAGDMLIDDLPYDVPTNQPPAGHAHEPVAPQSPTGNIFFPVQDNVSNAPPTTPFTPDYPRSPLPSGLTPNNGTPNMYPPQTQADPAYNPSPYPSPGISKPLPPPSFKSTGLGAPPVLHNEPPSAPDAKHESMEVLMGSTMEPVPSGQSQPKELLLPLEDEHGASTPSSELDPARMDFANPNPSQTGLPGRPGTPRIDHLEQTAMVPAVRRKQLAQDKTAPPLAPGANVLPELLEETQAPPRSSAPQMESHASGSLDAALVAPTSQGCPKDHCQLVFGGPLSLQTLAMFLQYASHTEKRLRSFLKKEDYVPITTHFRTEGQQTLITFGGTQAYLRCLLPAMLECCKQFSEEQRQELAEQLIDQAPEASQNTLRRASLQARITSRPYALTLQNDLTELSKASVLEVRNGLSEEPEVIYNLQEDSTQGNAEEDLTPAKLKLSNILLRHFNLFSLNQLMEDEFSLPLQDVVPLNLSIKSIFLAVIHHFEQRYQLPELAGAIQDKHPSFEAQPFESFPDI